MQFINLTPHAITLVQGAIEEGSRPGSFVAEKEKIQVILEIPKGDSIATIEFVEKSVEGNIPLRIKFLKEIANLPPQQEGTIYIVSLAVALAATGRDDLAVPGQQVRQKDDPRIVLGCLSLDLL
jgi:hypothetical protein